jgi:hypothetical protein
MRCLLMNIGGCPGPCPGAFTALREAVSHRQAMHRHTHCIGSAIAASGFSWAAPGRPGTRQRYDGPGAGSLAGNDCSTTRSSPHSRRSALAPDST